MSVYSKRVKRYMPLTEHTTILTQSVARNEVEALNELRRRKARKHVAKMEGKSVLSVKPITLPKLKWMGQC